MIQGNVFEGNNIVVKLVGQGHDEHVININLDLSCKGYTYKDSFEWDIVNQANM
jgi:hypothetical protein